MNPAEQALQQLRDQQAEVEAGLVERGWRFLSIAHGDLEDQDAVNALTHVGVTFRAVSTSGHPQIRGGNDYTTYCASPPDGDKVIAAVKAVAEEHNPGWWRITPTMQPDFGSHR